MSSCSVLLSEVSGDAKRVFHLFPQPVEGRNQRSHAFLERIQVAGLARSTMERSFPLDVPLTVDVGVGPDWKAAKP